MEPATLKALKASIKHWEVNVERAKLDMLVYNDIMAGECPLCERFVSSKCRINTELCPVAKKVASLQKPDVCACVETPWMDVKTALASRQRVDIILQFVKAELKFLKSLLPKKSKPALPKKRIRKI